MRLTWIYRALAIFAFVQPAPAQEDHHIPGIRASLRPASYHIPIGQPVWIRFSIENTTHEPITLTVPGTEPQIPEVEMGLPLTHVFSGGATSGIAVTTASGRRWERPMSYRTPTQAPILILAPHSTVGTTLDLREYFPATRVAGEYRVSWQPYSAGAASESVLLTIAPRKHVEITTDEGALTIVLFYDDAPTHVANFLELAKSHFYSGLTFHRIEPGYMIQGGCPRGDGTGIRLDGKRIPADRDRHFSELGVLFAN